MFFFSPPSFPPLPFLIVRVHKNDHVFDGHYEYVWNVCRPLVWAEGVCEEGKTAMCERIKDSRTVTGLYGESNQITWGLDDTERYVTEPDQPVAGVAYFKTLAGDCAFGGADTVRSRVYFTCDREAIDKVEVAVIYESYYSCTVFVEMKTALACSDIGERMPSLPLRSACLRPLLLSFSIFSPFPPRCACSPNLYSPSRRILL